MNVSPAIADLMAALEHATSDDFGRVQIDSDHAADFWQAFDAVKATMLAERAK